jgi:hypothetical protein
MPFQPDSPPTGNIPQPTTTQPLNKYHIGKLTLHLDPNDASALRADVTILRGYEDGGVFKPVETERHTLSGQSLIDAVNAVTTGGSVYGEVKTALWNLLLSENIVTSGTIV